MWFKIHKSAQIATRTTSVNICVIKRSNVHSRLSLWWVHSNSWTSFQFNFRDTARIILADTLIWKQNARDHQLAAEEAAFAARTQYARKRHQAISKINSINARVSQDSKEMEAGVTEVSKYINVYLVYHVYHVLYGTRQSENNFSLNLMILAIWSLSLFTKILYSPCKGIFYFVGNAIVVRFCFWNFSVDNISVRNMISFFLSQFTNGLPRARYNMSAREESGAHGVECSTAKMASLPTDS